MVSENFRVIKAMILDLESAIPTEAVLHSNQKMRQAWIDRVKQAIDIDALGRALYEVETNTRPEWTRPWHNSPMFRRACNAGVTSESHLAQLTFVLDQAICYNDEEQRGIEAIRQQLAEEEAAAAKEASAAGGSAAAMEDDDEDIVDACQVCRGAGDEDQTLLCDVCDLGYHMFCLTPPLTRLPPGEWICPKCRGKKGSRKKAAAAAAVVTRDGASTRQSSRAEIAAVNGLSSSRRGRGSAAAAAAPVGRQTAASLRAAAFAADDEDAEIPFAFPEWDPESDESNAEFAIPAQWKAADSQDLKAIDKCMCSVGCIV